MKVLHCLLVAQRTQWTCNRTRIRLIDCIGRLIGSEQSARFFDQAAVEHRRAAGVDAFVKSVAFRFETDSADSKSSKRIASSVPHYREPLARQQTNFNGPNQLGRVVGVNFRRGFGIESGKDAMEVGNRPLIRPSSQTNAKLF